MPPEATLSSEERQPSARLAVRPVDIVMTSLMPLVLPLVVYYIWFCLTFQGGALAMPSLAMVALIPLPTVNAFAIVGGWLIAQVLLQILAPGRWIAGTPLSDGTRLPYKMNGWVAWWTTWAGLAAGAALGLFSPATVADQLGPLLTTANIVAYLLSVYLCWHGTRFGTRDERIAHHPIYDFCLGTALNPRIKTFDLKLFCEARPGLIAWTVIDLSFAFKQYEHFGFVSVPMILVCAFHFWYVADYYFHEEAILTTWDIKHENFGWMLCWGDFVWVPFTYTIQASYLSSHAHDLPWSATAGIVLLNTAGYIVFRGANIQKHRFRENPLRLIWGKPAAFIRTARGALLLTSGWWGLSRHMNYLGDLLMGLAWCLPCLFGSPLPYFYIVYFAILLVHRERRDNDMCASRYGPDWAAYCAKVPYRIVPRIY